MVAVIRGQLDFIAWFLILPITCVCITPLFGDSGDNKQTILVGNVIDMDSAEPLAGAVIEVRMDGKTVGGGITAPDGSFHLTQLPEGDSRVDVSIMGFEDLTRTIHIRRGRSHSLNFSLKRNPIQLSPVEIIGESLTVNRKRVGTVTRLKREVVALIKPVGTQELLELVPGINGYADDGFGNSRLSIGIRGLNPRRSSRVLLLEDGVPIQPAAYVYPNAYYNPPSERVESIEIIKGSSAIRFGPQTMGGVINYRTRKPGGPKGFESQVATGNNGYYSLFNEWRGSISDKAKVDVQTLYKHGDGFRNNNTFDQVNGTFKTQYRISDKKVLYVKANTNFENSAATYTGLTEYSFKTNPNFNPKEYDNFKVLRQSLDVMYTSKITPNLVGNTSVYLSYFDRRWWREDDVFVRASEFATDRSPVPYFQTGDLMRIGGGASNFGILRTFYVGGIAQDYTLEHNVMGNKSRAEWGVRAHWERFIDDKKIGSAPDSRDGVYYTGTPNDPKDPVQIVGQSHHYETTALAVYVKEQIKRGNLVVTPGMRVEVFEQERIDRLRGSILADKVSFVVLPGLGGNYEFGRFNIFGGIHRGYTPPSSGALKITNFGQDTGSGGLDLKSEKSWNIETGVRSWGRNSVLEATAFLIRIEDLVAAGRGTAFKNLGKVQTSGFELSLATATSRKSVIFPDIHISYTLLNTEIKSGVVKSATMAGNIDVDLSGNELPYAPRHTVTVGLAKNFTDKLRLRADMRFVDNVFTDFENIERIQNRGDTGPVPSYSILNASVDYSINGGWSAFISAKNVLDEIYIGSRLHSNAGQPEANLSSGILVGPRRQINIGLKRNILN